MQKRWPLLLFLCPFFLVAQDSIVQDVVLTGTRIFSVKTLKERMVLKPGGAYTKDALETDIRSILRLYHQRACYLARVDSVTENRTGNGITLHFFISEDRPVRTGQLTFIGSHRFDETTLRSAAEWREGREFTPELLDGSIGSLLDWYDEQGYPFARITVARTAVAVSGDENVADVVLTTEESSTIRIDTILVNGNRTTKASAIVREFGMHFPERYRQSALNEGLARLRRSAFLSDAVWSGMALRSDSTVTLDLEVFESPSNRADGVAGYVPADRETGQKGYWTGMIDLSFRNLSGVGRRLDVRWLKKNRLSQELFAAYTEPWVLGFPLDAGISIHQEVRDSIYSKWEWALQSSYRLNAVWQVSGGYRFSTTEPSKPSLSYSFNVPENVTHGFSAGLSADSRDERSNPKKGFYYQTQFSYGRRNARVWRITPGSGDSIRIGGVFQPVRSYRERMNIKAVSVDLESYWPFSPTWVLFHHVHGAAYESSQPVVPLSEQFFFGGLRTVRGYPQDVFSGSRVAWSNFEIRYRASKDSRVFVFWDQGYFFRRVYTDENQTRYVKSDGFPRGFGFGMRFQTKAGQFALDYGLGRGDTFSTGKVHFGIATEF